MKNLITLYIILHLFIFLSNGQTSCYDREDLTSVRIERFNIMKNFTECTLLYYDTPPNSMNITTDVCWFTVFVENGKTLEDYAEHAINNDIHILFVPMNSAIPGKREYDWSGQNEANIQVYEAVGNWTTECAGQLIGTINKIDNPWTVYLYEKGSIILFMIVIILSHSIPTIHSIFVLKQNYDKYILGIQEGFLPIICIICILIGNLFRLTFVVVDPIGFFHHSSDITLSIVGTMSIPWTLAMWIFVGIYFYVVIHSNVYRDKEWILKLTYILGFILFGLSFIPNIISIHGVVTRNYILGYKIGAIQHQIFISLVAIISVFFSFQLYRIHKKFKQQPEQNQLKEKLRKFIKVLVLNIFGAVLNFISFLLFTFPFVYSNIEWFVPTAASIAVTLGLAAEFQLYFFIIFDDKQENKNMESNNSRKSGRRVRRNVRNTRSTKSVNTASMASRKNGSSKDLEIYSSKSSSEKSYDTNSSDSTDSSSNS